MNKREIIISIIVIAFVAFAIVYAPKQATRQGAEQPNAQTIQAEFLCDGSRSIKATFYPQPNDSVDLVLSDGRAIKLPRAMSGSGARYANPDESFVFWNKGDTAFIDENGARTFDNCAVKGAEAENSALGLANPASVNCEQKGGRVVMETNSDGSQYGLCYFDDNRACEEWAMMRGNCPVGGVKTTGFDAIEQKFCAWSGGKTIADPKAICDFNDGSSCELDELYKGQCKIGDYKIEKVLGNACMKDTDCETPAEYMVQSRCPFASKCVVGKCAVICPAF